MNIIAWDAAHDLHIDVASPDRPIITVGRVSASHYVSVSPIMNNATTTQTTQNIQQQQSPADPSSSPIVIAGITIPPTTGRNS